MNEEPFRQLCKTHPNVNCKREWGCPECVREMREGIRNLVNKWATGGESYRRLMLMRMDAALPYDRLQAHADQLDECRQELEKLIEP